MDKNTNCTQKGLDYKYMIAHNIDWFKKFNSKYKYDEQIPYLLERKYKGYLKITFNGEGDISVTMKRVVK